jgi:hypothetical protein
MEIKAQIIRSIRSYNLGYMLICGLGVFSILGQLVQGRHHDLSNTQTTHQLLGQKLPQSSLSSFASSLSSVTNDDGKSGIDVLSSIQTG